MPQPLYNTIVGVQANFHVSYPIHVIERVKCIGYIRKRVLNSHLGSNPDPCCIQNRVITNCVIKRLRVYFQILNSGGTFAHIRCIMVHVKTSLILSVRSPVYMKESEITEKKNISEMSILCNQSKIIQTYKNSDLQCSCFAFSHFRN